MKALDVASYFIELANETPENDLTNLKLQKLLYYVQGKYLSVYGNPAFEEKIEAWKYGPVVADVYHTFKECGQFPITNFDIDYEYTRPEGELQGLIRSVWEDIGKKYSGFYLVQTTHRDGAPWSLFFNESDRNIEIPNSSLKEYFASNEL